MTLFSRQGNNFQVTADEAVDIRKELPAGTYTVRFDALNERFFLQMVEGYEVPNKIYGDTLGSAVRILDTFQDRPYTTGVLLTGEKGSGKTMLAKLLSLEGLKKGYPTILVNEPWAGEQFNSFMQQIEQPTIVIFDEFEKVYDREAQEKMLTLLDGVYPAKKLYILTCNDQYRINEHMRNRPGRIYYRLDYKGLDRDFIVEYCQDNLIEKGHIETICKLAVLFSAFNFDILKAMVEEMNRYGETPQQVMKFLNASPEYSDTAKFDVALEINGVEVLGDRLYEKSWAGNPLNGNMLNIGYYSEEKDNDGDPIFRRERFSLEDLQSVDSQTGFLFVNKNGNKLGLTKHISVSYSYDAI